MVEHHGHVGHGPAQVDQLGQLRVVHPGVEAETGGAEGGEPGAEVVLLQQIRWRVGVRDADVGAGVPGVGVADAAEPPSARLDVGGEDVGDLGSGEVGEADDAGDEAVRVGGDHELGLTDGPERLRAVGAVGGGALHEHRRRDVRPTLPVSDRRCGIRYGLSAVLPEVVVRVDDHRAGIVARIRTRRTTERPRTRRRRSAPPRREPTRLPLPGAQSSTIRATSPLAAAGVWTSSSSCRHSTISAPRSRPASRARNGHRPSLEQLGRRALDHRVAPVATHRRGVGTGVALADVVDVGDAEADQPAAVRPAGAADLPGLVGVAEVGHRHRVRRLEPAQGVGAVAGRLAVHRAEDGDLGRRPIDAELVGHRGVHVVGLASRGRGPDRRRPRPARAARSGRGRRGRTRGPARRRRPGGARRAGCAARRSPSSARRRRPNRSSSRAAARRGRGRRASRSRTSWPCAPPAASVEQGVDDRVGVAHLLQPPGPGVGDLDADPPQQRPHVGRVAQVGHRARRRVGEHGGVALPSAAPPPRRPTRGRGPTMPARIALGRGRRRPAGRRRRARRRAPRPTDSARAVASACGRSTASASTAVRWRAATSRASAGPARPARRRRRPGAVGPLRAQVPVAADGLVELGRRRPEVEQVGLAPSRHAAGVEAVRPRPRRCPGRRASRRAAERCTAARSHARATGTAASTAADRRRRPPHPARVRPSVSMSRDIGHGELGRAPAPTRSSRPRPGRRRGRAGRRDRRRRGPPPVTVGRAGRGRTPPDRRAGSRRRRC